jgi:hypothetical protein
MHLALDEAMAEAIKIICGNSIPSDSDAASDGASEHSGNDPVSPSPSYKSRKATPKNGAAGSRSGAATFLYEVLWRGGVQLLFLLALLLYLWWQGQLPPHLERKLARLQRWLPLGKAQIGGNSKLEYDEL